MLARDDGNLGEAAGGLVGAAAAVTGRDRDSRGFLDLGIEAKRGLEGSAVN